MAEAIRIYYFSGTGNSLSIAKDLVSQMGNAKLLSIASLLKIQGVIKVEGDTIGFVFPVYFGRVPVIVEEFLARAKFGDTGYLFAVANGGGAYCRTHKILDKQLRKKGRSLSAGFTIGMPGVHPKVKDNFIKKTQAEFFDAKRRRIEELSGIIQRKEERRLETNFGLAGILLSHVFFKSLYKKSLEHSLDRIYWTDDTCKKCGTCRDICPVQNIELDRSGPKWLGKCANCGRCYHLCPNEAIQMGKDFMPRYKNPDAELEELMI